MFGISSEQLADISDKEQSNSCILFMSKKKAWWRNNFSITYNLFAKLLKLFCLCLLVVKKELEAEAVALTEKEKAATAEVCLLLDWLVWLNHTAPVNSSLARRWVDCQTVLVIADSFQGSKVPVKDSTCLSVSGVYFTCPLTGATLTKSEREAHIKEAIFMVGLQENHPTLMFWLKTECLCDS